MTGSPRPNEQPMLVEERAEARGRGWQKNAAAAADNLLMKGELQIMIIRAREVISPGRSVVKFPFFRFFGLFLGDFLVYLIRAMFSPLRGSFSHQRSQLK